MTRRTDLALSAGMALIGPIAVVVGWVWAGIPESSAEALCCVLLHVYAVFTTGVGVLMWRWSKEADCG